MYLPPGMTETGVIKIIDDAVALLAHQFTYGPHTKEDIHQEGWVESLKALPKYEEYDENGKRRPLAGFIYTHVLHRFINMYRDNWHKPCPVEFTSGVMPEDELRYERWQKKNSLKKNVLMPKALAECYHSYNENDEVIQKIEIEEVETIIDQNLDVGLRQWYLQMKSGENVPYARRVAVTNAIKNILQEGNYEINL